jgi:hypothetical protein
LLEGAGSSTTVTPGIATADVETWLVGNADASCTCGDVEHALKSAAIQDKPSNVAIAVFILAALQTCSAYYAGL